MTERDESLSREELRTRASAGVFFTVASGFVVLFLGFFGQLVLARLLTPRDFGIVAIGATATLLASALAEGGLASGLIRRPYAPTKAELRTLTGIQLLFTVPPAALGTVIALQFGTAGAVTAVMLWSVPVSAFVAPGRVVLTRQLLYSRIAVAELASTVAYYAFAIPAAEAGMGVWSMAIAVVIKVVTSALVVGLLCPSGFTAPSLRRAREFGEIIRFGLTFQAGWITVVVRDQILNIVTAVIGGITALGLWSLARRLMELPMMLPDSINRVTFPAMSHLLAEKEDPRTPIEKSTRMTAILLAVFLSAFASASIGLVPFAFGEEWSEAAWIIPPATLGLLFAAPSSVGATGFIFAAGKPGVYVRITIIYSAVWIATSAALLPFIGVAAVGVGWIPGGILEAAMLSRVIERDTGARVLACSLAPTGAGVAGGIAGLGVALAQDTDLVAGLTGGLVAASVSSAALCVVCWGDVRTTIDVLWGTVRDAAHVGMERGSNVSDDKP